MSRHKEAEIDITNSDAFSSGILDSLSSHIALINASGTIIKVNKSWKNFACNNGVGEMNNYGEGANYFGVCNSPFTGGDDIAAKAIEGIKKVLNGTLSDFYLDYPFHTPEEERWFNMRVVKFESTEPLVLIEHQYITERMQAEDKLKVTSVELQHALCDMNKIMDSSLDVICAVDETGCFLQVSAACEAIWGYKADELIGKPLLDFVCPEDQQITRHTASQVMTGKNATNFENRYIRKDGSIVPMEWTARWDAKNRIRYGVARDATAKKRSDMIFETERKRFDELFLQAPSCMGILKGPTHIFEMANPLYLQLIGKDDIIGKSVKDVLPEIAGQGFIELLDGVYKTGKSFSANEMLVKLDKGGSGKLIDTYLNFIYQAYRDKDGSIDGIFFFAIDVTEQVLSRKKTEESEERYRSLIEQAIDPICIADINMKIMDINPSGCRLLGYSKEEFLQLSVADLFLREDLIANPFKIDELRSGKTISNERRFKRKDGTLVEMEVNGKILEDGRFMIIGREITERKQAEKLIKESEMRYRSLVEQATDAISMADASMRFIDLNPYACHILGYSIEEALQLSVPDVLFAEDFATNPFKLEELKSGEIIRNERRFKRKDGSSVILEVSTKLLEDGRFIMFGHDISERKQAEKLVKESEIRYRSLIEQATDAIFIADASLQFIDMNPYACGFLGYTKEEALQLFVPDILFPEDMATNPITKFYTIKVNEIVRNERRFKRKDGSSVVMEVSSRLMEDGKFIMFGHDVSERKKAEEIIRRSEASLDLKNKELELKNKELEHFAYVASHDLQEPLRTTSSFVNLLQQQYHGKLDERADKYLHYIVDSSDRMKILITDLLDYSRIGNKKEVKQVDCTTVLNEVLQDLDTTIKETGAEIKADTLPVISGYQTEIKQLFQNLVVNAIKFRKKDTIPKVSISARKDNGYWVFGIQDNGIGIAKDHTERIFIIFQRLHTRTEYEGSGIGLAHCKKIVGLHGGKIWVESKPGEGATFYFTIP